VNEFFRREFDKYAFFISKADVREQLEMAIDEALGVSVSKKPLAPVPPSTPSKERAKKTVENKDVITSPFGERIDPLTGEKGAFHGGIDLRAKEGDSILAWDNGVVIEAGTSQRSGNFVVIEHRNEVRTSYSHLSKISVSKGQKINRGDVIGMAGETGRATAPHLHFRMDYKGNKIDPAPYLGGRQIVVRNGG